MLVVQLAAMATLIACAVLFPQRVTSMLAQPALYLHAKLVHVLCVTLFFGNVVIGTLWETRSLLSHRAEVIRHTYQTVAWLDAFFTAPLILLSVVSGLVLAAGLGGLFAIGWLTLAFALFIGSGVVWIAVDIPTQYQVKRLFAGVPPGADALPPELMRVLRFRLGLNCMAVVPLLVVFALMVHKPRLPALTAWLAR
jgi:uncharacterized membrane protein